MGSHGQGASALFKFHLLTVLVIRMIILSKQFPNNPSFMSYPSIYPRFGAGVGLSHTGKVLAFGYVCPYTDKCHHPATECGCVHRGSARSVRELTTIKANLIRNSNAS